MARSGRSTTPPVLVVAHGQMLEAGMASTGLSVSDVRSTLRTAVVSSLADVMALVFEPTGDLSVFTAPVNELDPRLFEAVSGIDALGLPRR